MYVKTLKMLTLRINILLQAFDYSYMIVRGSKVEWSALASIPAIDMLRIFLLLDKNCDNIDKPTLSSTV